MKKHFRIKKTLVLLLLAANIISSVYSPVYATESMETYTESDFHAIEEKEEDVLQEDAASCNTELLPEESQDTSIENIEKIIYEDEEVPAENIDESLTESFDDIQKNLDSYQENFDKSQENLDGYQELIDEPPFPVVNLISDNQMHTASVEEEEIPSSYNSTEDFHIALPEYMPDLRNQTPYGSCWSFTSLSLGEIYMKKYGIAWLDLSELHLAYFSYNYQPDPLGGTLLDKNWATYDSSAPNFLQRGGNLSLSQNILASWLGAAEESLVPYNTASTVINEGINPDYAYKDVAHLTHYYNVNVKNDPQSVKKLIMQNGAIGCSYFHDTSKYNRTHNSYYTKTSPNQINHAITIVGWNDDFPAEYFNEAPEGDGAWLIRNSWWNSGSDLENLNGYFWLSYYDKSLHSNGFSFAFDTAEKYDNNYQYDGASINGSFTLGAKSITGANVFCAKVNEAGETLEAVSFATADANVDYKIDIYVNPIDETKPDSGTHIAGATTEGTITYAGYYTIPLAQKVTLENGDIFSVVVKLSSTSGSAAHLTMEISSDQGWVATTAATQPGQSFYLKSGNWIDNSNKENYGNFRIKAFTKNVHDPTFVSLSDFSFSEDTQKMHLLPGEEQQAEVIFEPADATRKSLLWESDNPQVAEVTEAGNILAHSVGDASITASYKRNGQIDIQKSFPVRVSLLQWTNEVEELQVGKQALLEYETNIEGEPNWNSSAEEILSVNEEGQLTAKEVGEAVITLTIAGKNIHKNIQVIEPEKELNEKEIWGDISEEDRVEKEFSTPEKIPQGFWTTKVSEYRYTGRPIRPSLRVYRGKRLLRKDKDYSISYKNNINAGNASIVITGKGYYTGSIKIPFQILPLDISVPERDKEDSVILSSNPLYVIFNNKVQKGAVTVTYQNQGKRIKLKKGTDYTFEYPHTDMTEVLEYDENAFKAIGTYSIRLVGKGNCTGSREITECITDATLMKKLSYSISNEIYDYSAENIRLKQEILPKKIIVRQGNQTLNGFYAKGVTSDEKAFQAYEEWLNAEENAGRESYHFIYYALNHTSVGTAKLIFLGIEENGFAGKVEKSYKIAGRALSKARFGKELTRSYQWTENMAETYYWEGDEIGPVVPKTTEELNGSKKGASVTYKTTSGSRIPLNGILKEKYEAIETEEDKVQYDYVYEYTGNLDTVGTVKIQFTGINGYRGNVTKAYKIMKVPEKKKKYSFATDDEHRILVEPLEKQPYEKGGVKPLPKVWDGEKQLENDVDYTLTYRNNKAVNDGSDENKPPTVIITGKGNYTGTIKVYYAIEAADIGTCEMTVGDILYREEENICKPTISIVDGKSRKKLTAGTDFDVTVNFSYPNGDPIDVKHGVIPLHTELMATVTGRNNYQGTISKTFRFVEKDINQAKVFIPSQAYTGDPITLEKDQLSIRFNYQNVTEDQFEIVSYEKNIKLGTAKVIIQGLGEYGGRKTVSFKIVKKRLLLEQMNEPNIE